MDNGYLTKNIAIMIKTVIFIT